MLKYNEYVQLNEGNEVKLELDVINLFDLINGNIEEIVKNNPSWDNDTSDKKPDVNSTNQPKPIENKPTVEDDKKQDKPNESNQNV